MNNTLIFGIIVAGVALLFCIIATATPYWWGNGTYNMGLFQHCLDFQKYGKICEGIIKDADSWIKATGVLMILSILALTASLSLAVLFGLVLKDKQIVAIFAAFLSFTAAVLTLLGVVVFGAKIPLEKMRPTSGSFHASYGMAIVGLFTDFVAGVLFFRSRTRNV